MSNHSQPRDEWVYLPGWNTLRLYWPNGTVRYEVDLDRSDIDWADQLSTKRWMTPKLMADLLRKMAR